MSSTLGTDILLARHGDAITTWRVDKTGQWTVVKLGDGSWDMAPNALPDVVRSAPVREFSPAEPPARKAINLGRVLAKELLPEDRSERRLLGRIIGWWTVGSLALTGVLIALASRLDTDTLNMIVSHPGTGM